MSSDSDELLRNLLINAKDIDIVRPKFNELLRKSRTISQLSPRQEQYRLVAVCEISCELLRVPFNKHMRQRRVSNNKDYQNTKLILSGVLNARVDFDPRSLLLKYNLTETFQNNVKGVLSKFNETFVCSLDPSRQSQYDLNSKLYFVIGFYVASAEEKIKVSRKELAELAGVDNARFNRLCDEVYQAVLSNNDSAEIDPSLRGSTPLKRQRTDNSIPKRDCITKLPVYDNDNSAVDYLKTSICLGSSDNATSSSANELYSSNSGPKIVTKVPSLRQQRLVGQMPHIAIANAEDTQLKSKQSEDDRNKKDWERNQYEEWKKTLSNDLVTVLLTSHRPKLEYFW